MALHANNNVKVVVTQLCRLTAIQRTTRAALTRDFSCAATARFVDWRVPSGEHA
jgi:hypothetical protein